MKKILEQVGTVDYRICSSRNPRMIHPDTDLHVFDGSIGPGVRATQNIPKGTLLWVRDSLDRVLRDETKRRMPALSQAECARLGYQDHRGYWVLCWDNAKYVNHSCAPTMRGVGHDAMIAVRDVLAGEELSCDYAECNLETALECRCGASSCRGEVASDDLVSRWQEWQNEVDEALTLANLVAQPLVEVAIHRHALERVLRGESRPLSLREVYFDRSITRQKRGKRRRRASRSASVRKLQKHTQEAPRSSLQMDSTETRVLPNGQRGLFAVRDIPAGEIVVVFGGQAMTLDEIRALPDDRRRFALQVEDGVFLYSTYDGPGDWVNHSCDPNAGFVGQVALVAMRDISNGEEVCFDYAMSDMEDYDQFQCQCGAVECRGKVSSKDWMLPQLHAKYGGFFSSHVQRAILGLGDVEVL